MDIVNSIRKSLPFSRSFEDTDEMVGDSKNPQKGDKVSWPWGANAPSGVVADKKTQGEATVTSHRGNVIRKSAEPDDPALEITRPGNDVVKKQSEVDVVAKQAAPEKAKAGSSPGKKRPQTPKLANGTLKKSTASPEKRKRAAEEDASADADDTPPAKRGPGRPKGSKKGTIAPTRRSGREPAEVQRLLDEPVVPSKSRGRPKKDASRKAGAAADDDDEDDDDEDDDEEAAPKARRPGRPPGTKNKSTTATTKTSKASTDGVTKRRGRPPGSGRKETTAAPKPRGRPPGSGKKATTAAPKPRGRPPGSGRKETTAAPKPHGRPPGSGKKATTAAPKKASPKKAPTLTANGKPRGRPPGSKNK